MLQYDKTFPTLDCAACIGTPKMVAVGQDKNIHLMTNAEVESVNGFIGNFKVNVNQRSRYVKDELHRLRRLRQGLSGRGPERMGCRDKDAQGHLYLLPPGCAGALCD